MSESPPASLPRTVLVVAAVVLASSFALAACRARRPPGPPDTVPAGPGNRPWYAGTPEMRAKIHALLARVPSTVGAERIDLGRQILAFGEPAVPILVEALQAPEPDTRSTAAWLLGFAKDPRTAPALRRAMADPDRLVSYEAASSLLLIGDRQGLVRIVEGLEDPDPRIRAKCGSLLAGLAGDDYGYRADDPPEERAPAVARWRSWADHMLRSVR